MYASHAPMLEPVPCYPSTLGLTFTRTQPQPRPPCMQEGKEVPDELLVPLMVLGMVESQNFIPQAEVGGWKGVGLAKRM